MKSYSAIIDNPTFSGGIVQKEQNTEAEQQNDNDGPGTSLLSLSRAGEEELKSRRIVRAKRAYSSHATSSNKDDHSGNWCHYSRIPFVCKKLSQRGQ